MRQILISLIFIMSFMFVSCVTEDEDTGNTGNTGDTGNTGNSGDTGNTENNENFPHSHEGLNWSEPSEEVMSWSDAKRHCESMIGRLPTISELRTLINNCPSTQPGGACKVDDNCLSQVSCWSDECLGCSDLNADNCSVFNDKGWFWSGSLTEEAETHAWRINFDDGNLGAYDVETQNLVRCVEDKNKELFLAEFFSKYFEKICNLASKCSPGVVTSENLNYCQDVMMYSPVPFPAFERERDIIFMEKYIMLEKAEKTGQLIIDMDQSEKCFSEIESKYQSGSLTLCNPMRDIHIFDISACASVFKGTVSVDNECKQDEECFSGWCDISTGCPGACVQYKNPTESCNKEVDKCSPGFYCSSSGSCMKISPAMPGDPCRVDSDCDNILFCRKNSSSDELGSCFSKKESGDSCQSDNECKTGLICIGDICSSDGLSNISGTNCDEWDGFAKCNVFSKLECGPNLTCQLFPSSGQECSTICEKDLFCNSSTSLCENQSLEGESCKSDSQCTTFNCDDGICKISECVPSNI